MEEQNKNLEENIKRHISVLTEDFKGETKIVSEQYAGLTKKVDLILEDMGGVKSDIVDMKRDIKEIKVELVEMNGKLDSKSEKEVTDDHETRIVKLEKTALSTR